MRVFSGLSLALVVLPVLSFPVLAKADTLVLGLQETTAVDSLSAGHTLSQAVSVSATTTISEFGFFLSDPSGNAMTYSITDVTTGSSLLFSQTINGTTLVGTDAGDISEAIPTGNKDWLDLFTGPVTLNAGDIYDFSISGVGALKVGISPTASADTEIGLAPVGQDVELGLRVWDPPAVTPEPSSLVLMGTGILAAAGAMRKRIKA